MFNKRDGREPQSAEINKRDITCRAYRIAPESIDEQNRSVTAVIATETPVMVFDMRRWEPILEILVMSGVRLAERIVFVDSHDLSSTEKVIGSTVDLRVEGGNLVGRNIYSKVDDAEKAQDLDARSYPRCLRLLHREDPDRL